MDDKPRHLDSPPRASTSSDYQERLQLTPDSKNVASDDGRSPAKKRVIEQPLRHMESPKKLRVESLKKTKSSSQAEQDLIPSSEQADKLTLKIIPTCFDTEQKAAVEIEAEIKKVLPKASTLPSELAAKEAIKSSAIKADEIKSSEIEIKQRVAEKHIIESTSQVKDSMTFASVAGFSHTDQSNKHSPGKYYCKIDKSSTELEKLHITPKQSPEKEQPDASIIPKSKGNIRKTSPRKSILSPRKSNLKVGLSNAYLLEQLRSGQGVSSDILCKVTSPKKVRFAETETGKCDLEDLKEPIKCAKSSPESTISIKEMVEKSANFNPNPMEGLTEKVKELQISQHTDSSQDIKSSVTNISPDTSQEPESDDEKLNEMIDKTRSGNMKSERDSLDGDLGEELKSQENLNRMKVVAIEKAILKIESNYHLYCDIFSFCNELINMSAPSIESIPNKSYYANIVATFHAIRSGFPNIISDNKNYIKTLLKSLKSLHPSGSVEVIKIWLPRIASNTKGLGGMAFLLSQASKEYKSTASTSHLYKTLRTKFITAIQSMFEIYETLEILELQLNRIDNFNQ